MVAYAVTILDSGYSRFYDVMLFCLEKNKKIVMKALLDTNIIIHREAIKVVNQDIGILFKWLDKTKYQKCIHTVTINEIRKNPNPDTVATFNICLLYTSRCV